VSAEESEEKIRGAGDNNPQYRVITESCNLWGKKKLSIKVVNGRTFTREGTMQHSSNSFLSFRTKETILPPKVRNSRETGAQAAKVGGRGEEKQAIRGINGALLEPDGLVFRPGPYFYGQ